MIIARQIKLFVQIYDQGQSISRGDFSQLLILNIFDEVSVRTLMLLHYEKQLNIC